MSSRNIASLMRLHQMEDEDADFLGDTLDFGDGRQYKVQVEEELKASNREQDRGSDFSTSDRLQGSESSLNKVVTKEERFAEDIPRSWPRNQGPLSMKSPVAPERPESVASVSTRDSVSLHSPDKPTPRALFNERLNRLEPWDTKSMPSESDGPDKTVLSWK